MKTYLHSEFIDERLLTDDERQQIETEHEHRLATIEKKYVLQQQQMMEEEEKLYDSFARQAGFSGYNTGNDSYESHYNRYIKNPKDYDIEIAGKLRKFSSFKIQSPEYDKLIKRSRQAVQDERKEKEWEKQLRLNKILERIHTRANPKKDSDGKHIVAPRTYNALDEAKKKELDKALVQEYVVKNKKGDEGEKIGIDRGISQYVTKLWEINVRTNASCSGMVGDHPYQRWQENDRFGRWKKGDLVKATGAVTSAYLSVPYRDNHPVLLRRAAETAREWGWTTENRTVYDEESLVFYPPHTLDGTSYDMILLEAGELRESFLQSGEAADEEEARVLSMQQAERNHGGAIHYTDAMLRYNFMRLAEGMTVLQSKIRMEERDYNIKTGKAVNLYRYDSQATQLTAAQLADVFKRSKLKLDISSVNRPLDKNCTFIEKDGLVRLMAENEPEVPWMMVDKSHTLSYLMATQIKGTPTVGYNESTVSVMVHPDPLSAEVSSQFTVTKDLDSIDYYRYFVNDNDMSLYLGNRFTEELYRAAQHCHDNRQEKKAGLEMPGVLSDIRIRKAMDKNWYISCKISGEQQLSKRLTINDANYYRMRMNQSDKAYNGVAPELAKKYYAEEIQACSMDRQQQRNMKR